MSAGARGFALGAAFQAPARSRKLRMIVTPCSDRMLSGWNCTPWIGRASVRQPHDQAVAGLGRDGEVRRAGVAVDDQRMVARRAEGAVDAAEHRLAAMLDPRPCRASAGARAPPCRRRPGRSPAGRGRRRRSGSAAPALRPGRGRCRPRSACRAPARARWRPARRRATSSTSIVSLRTTATLAPSGPSQVARGCR